MKKFLEELNQAGIALELNGDKLKVHFLRDDADENILGKISERKQEIITFLSREEEKFDSIPAIPVQENYPLSNAQKRLWFISQFGQGSEAYNVPIELRLSKETSLTILHQSIDYVVNRHEILRTIFKESESREIRQWVIPTDQFNYNIDYLDFQTENNAAQLAQQFVREDSVKPFDLEKGPLFRAAIIELEEEYVFYFNLHHIISDGWSRGVIHNDILMSYTALLVGETPSLPELRIQYKDFTHWQLNKLQNGEYDEARQFWEETLKGELPRLDFPRVKIRPKNKTYNGETLSTYINSELTTKLRSFCQTNNGSLYSGLLTVWNILSYKFTFQKDIIVASPIAGRDHEDLLHQIGYYANTLVFRNKVNPEQSFQLLFEQVSANVLASFEHQMYPFDLLVEDLNIHRSTDRNAIFDLMFSLQNLDENNEVLSLSAEEAETINVGNTTVSRFDLEVVFQEVDKSLYFSINYNTDIYDRQIIENIMKQFSQLLGYLNMNPEVPVGDICFLSASEKHEQLFTFNNGTRYHESEKTLIDLFQEQVSLHPDEIALVVTGKEFSYKELDEESNQFANYLRNKYDLKREDIVALKLERNKWMIIAILGVLKASCAYLPIDPSYPQDRIDFIETDCASKVVVDGLFIEEFQKCMPSISSERLELLSSPTDLAYVIYTSGSTGQPKGVLVEHRNVVRLVDNPDYIRCETGDAFLALSNFAFDGAVFDLFMPLLNGGKIILSDKKITLDLDKFNQIIEVAEIQSFFITTVLFNALVEAELSNLKRLKYILFGGEQVSVQHVRDFKKRYPEVNLVHVYGPTENTVFSTAYPVENIPAKDQTTVPIGKAIKGSKCYILGESKEILPAGAVGEIYVGGAGVGRGYHNRPELTKERFIKNPHIPEEIIYRTGDMGRWLSNGSIEFMGRTDDQVKIRGHRIELGEIEHVLRDIKGIETVAVLVEENSDKELVAYVVQNVTRNSKELKKELGEVLPAYMIPERFVFLKTMPITANGKIDKNALPKCENQEVNEIQLIPKGELEIKLREILASVLGRNEESIGVDDNFFELGANSMKLIRLLRLVNAEFNAQLNIVTLFEYPTIQGVASYINGREESSEDEEFMELNQFGSDIAIVGMSGKFSKSSDIRDFWEKLTIGQEMVHFYSDDELEALGIDVSNLSSKFVNIDTSVESGGYFDYKFFGYSYEEAQIMNPQTRMMHQQVWLALEDANIVTEKNNNVGLFLSAGESFYWHAHSLLNPDDKINPFFQSQLSDSAFIHTLISYNLNLKGPSLNIDTACSSSLVAIHLACKSLLANECNAAIAGGVRLDSDQEIGYVYETGMIGAKDGHCKPFDANSSGTIRGNGAAVVVLKRLEEAVRENDNIYAIIKSTAINNDGKDKVGYTAPSVMGQSSVIRRALRLANVAPEEISYVEAHGTATKIGDPIEVESLNKAFNYNTNHKCAIGSVKSNIGHMGYAAGVAGVIKTALSLQNKLIPASLHFESPNPDIKFEQGPFVVNSALSEWKPKNGETLKAGVSSFGIGGTNAHAVMEEYKTSFVSDEGRSINVLTLSAASPKSLEGIVQNVSKEIFRSNVKLADFCYTLNTSRKAHKYRVSVAGKTPEELSVSLKEADINPCPLEKGKVVFMFPGQGTQYATMAKEIYDQEAFFRLIIDKGLHRIKEKTNEDYATILGLNGETNEDIYKSTYTQPLLFIVEVALAKLLMHWGISPDQLIGHSLGEYVAACISGVFSFESGIDLMIERARLMEATPEGAMLSVESDVMSIQELLTENISAAAVNTIDSCVLSGSNESISALENQLKLKEIGCTRLKTSLGFHSYLMDGILDEFEKKVAEIELSGPVIPIISNLTGVQLTNEQATSPKYWSNHLRKTVLFEKGLSNILQDKNTIMIELGPGNVLSRLVRQHIRGGNAKCVQLMRSAHSNENDNVVLSRGIGLLWENGIEPDWDTYYKNQVRFKVSAPTYHFDTTEFPVKVNPVNQFLRDFGVHQMTNKTDDGLFVVNWKQSKFNTSKITPSYESTVLLFESDISSLTDSLLSSGAKVVRVRVGEAFSRKENHFEIDPNSEEDYKQLFAHLKESKIELQHVIMGFELEDNGHDRILEGTCAMLYLCQQLIAWNTDLTLSLLSYNSQKVYGMETPNIVSSTMTQIGLITGQENPNIIFNTFDVDASESESNWSQFIQEFRQPQAKDVAYRNGVRWIRFYDKIEIDSPNDSAIKHGGIYVITGGLGKVGLSLAEYLSDNYKATVYLYGRRYFETEGNLIVHESDNHYLQKFNELVSRGCNISYLQVDVSNYEVLEQSLENLFSKHGAINGVIHAAGNTNTSDFKTIDNTDERNVVSHFKSKVQGTINLHSILKKHSVDFVWLTSSLSVMLGGLTFGAYSAANKFIDALVQKNETENNWYSVNLDGISEGKINNHKLIETFEKSLISRTNNQLIVSHTDLNSAPSDGSENQVKPSEKMLLKPIENRPDLLNQFEDSSTSLEARLCEMWQDFFNMEKIGVTDDFFDLGGTSLSAMNLLKRIGNEFKQELDMHAFYDGPTIRKLSKAIHAKQLNAQENKMLGSVNDNPWLYLFPPHIGSSLIFNPFVKFLNGEFNTQLFHSSGVQRNEKHCKSIEEEAAIFKTQILENPTTKEITLMGYSFGSYLAFETARQLEAENVKVSVILMDVPVDIRDRLEQKENQLDNLISKVRGYFSDQELKRLEKVIENNFRMLREFKVGGKLNAPITCIEAVQNDEDREMWRWQEFSNRKVEIYQLHCEHDEMMDEVNYNDLKRILAEHAKQKNLN
jgi:polyketide synthase PksJ